VLSGIRHLVLVDNDAIETSNLSRTVLFRAGDQRARKCTTAAARLAAMAPAADAHIVPLDVDVVWGVGAGVYRRIDVVLGCVDSTEARAAVGGAAWRLGVPAVVGGIFALDGSLVVQGANGACVACTFGAGDWADRSARYSCDDVRRVLAARSALPATQVVASVTGGLMAAEALQLLHATGDRTSVRIWLGTRLPLLRRVPLRRRPRCPFHTRIETVREDPALTAGMTAGDLVERVAVEHGGRSIDLGVDYLLAGRCKACGSELPLMRARPATTERDLVCDRCWSSDAPLMHDPRLEVVREISPASPPAVLDRTLQALGVPALHLLAVRAGEQTHWVELTGDLDRVLPRWPAS
jgi:adenylyltransferase/sulfurtransferase